MMVLITRNVTIIGWSSPSYPGFCSVNACVCDNFGMSEDVTVKLSPNRSNIMYVERRRTDLETDFSESLSTLKEKLKDTLVKWGKVSIILPS